jgi:hypothetical protein
LADKVRDILRRESVALQKSRCEVERIRIMRKVDSLLDILVELRNYKEKPTNETRAHLIKLVNGVEAN